MPGPGAPDFNYTDGEMLQRMWNCHPPEDTFELPEGLSAEDLADCEPGTVVPLEDSTKPTNPKDAAAFDKAPLHLVPASFKAYTAVALAEGAMKYGSWNWRAAGVRASVYVSALQRHLDKWFNGEEFDPKTGVPHLANAAACLAVLIDSKTQMNMTDDRPPRQYALPGLIDKEVPHAIAGLRETFGHMTPKHWTINDYPEEHF